MAINGCSDREAVKEFDKMTESRVRTPQSHEEFERLMGWEVSLDYAVAENNVKFVRNSVSNPDFMMLDAFCRDQAVCDAAHKGRTQIMELLLSSGHCGTDRPCRMDTLWKRQPIHLAASNGHLEIVQMLVKAGVDLESQSADNEKRTPLHWAVSEGRLDVAVYLVEQGASITALQADDFSVMHGAAWLGNCDLCRLLISHGAEVNQTDTVMGMTPFHCLASASTDLTAFQLFLDAGADINARTTSDQETALHMMMYRPSEEVIRFMLHRGAALEARDSTGETPLFRAVIMDNTNMCELLLDYGADICTRNNLDQSLLYIAMQADRLSPSMPVINLLINEGFPIQSETWLRLKQWPCRDSSNPEICSWLHNLASNPCDLQTLSRTAIRRLLGPEKKLKSSLLPLPTPLQEYVRSLSYSAQ